LPNQNSCAPGAKQAHSDFREQSAGPRAARFHKVTRQLEIFAVRCIELGDRAAAGEIKFLDAVDLAYSAAIWADLPNAIEASGLIDIKLVSGDDIVQATLAAAFANARRPS
jgi:hypothetical protein